jgi:hypothetical protein
MSNSENLEKVRPVQIIRHILRRSPNHGRPQAFFQGRAKIFQGEGAKTYFLPKKTTKKILFFQKKSKNKLFLAGLAGQGQQEPPLPPRPPADAHASNPFSKTLKTVK